MAGATVEKPNRTQADPGSGNPQQLPPVVMSLTEKRIQDQEDHLTSKGWTNVGLNAQGETVWSDPHGRSGPDSKGEKVFQQNMKTPSGGQEPLAQMTVPPTAWNWPRNKAFEIQKARDEQAAVTSKR